MHEVRLVLFRRIPALICAVNKYVNACEISSRHLFWNVSEIAKDFFSDGDRSRYKGNNMITEYYVHIYIYISYDVINESYNVICSVKSSTKHSHYVYRPKGRYSE